MFVSAQSATLLGVDAMPVQVEAFKGQGLPSLTLVGLARGAVRESLIRVRSALQSVDTALTTAKLVVNMLPAELPKEASALDLPLAAVLLAVAHKIPLAQLVGRRFFGELSLGGQVQQVRGAVLLADLSRREGDKELIVPKAQAQEAAVIPGVRVIGVATLAELLAHLRGEVVIDPERPSEGCIDADAVLAASFNGACLSDVRGQRLGKRALEVAAAGNHNLLLVGPPGSGKTMLASRLQGLLPAPSPEERIAITRIRAAAAASGQEAHTEALTLALVRPFRAPHHSISDVALVGGGAKVLPGEVTRAHLGVLFLDELPEFSRRALEALREPLEAGSVRISRAMMSAVLPSDVLLVAAMNPCPCGQLRPPGSPATSLFGGRPCLCAMEQVQRYRARISGPLLDRIDLRVQVAPVSFAALCGSSTGPRGVTSDEVRVRVAEARQRQSARLGVGRTNASMVSPELAQHVPLRGKVADTIKWAMSEHDLSARSVTRVLKVARTVADLAGADVVLAKHVRLALALRLWERPIRASGRGRDGVLEMIPRKKKLRPLAEAQLHGDDVAT